jgi:hypothetical protein
MPPINAEGIKDFLKKGILLLRTFPKTRKTSNNTIWMINDQTLSPKKLLNEKSHIN